MDRRQFLLWGGCAGVVAIGGFALSRGRRSGPAQEDWSRALFDERFESYARERASEESALRDALEQKGVLGGDMGFDAARVRELARRDVIVPYGEFTYTETELQLYALAWLRQRRGAESASSGSD